MNIAGHTLRTDQVRALARLLGDDPLADRLMGSVEHGVTIFALSPADRGRILSLELDGHLAGLKQHLDAQRTRQRALEARQERVQAQRLRHELRGELRATRPPVS